MDLNYVFLRNQTLAKMVKDQGYDLDSLIYMCKDIRELFKELNLEKQEIFEVLENLKKAYE